MPVELKESGSAVVSPETVVAKETAFFAFARWGPAMCIDFCRFWNACGFQNCVTSDSGRNSRFPFGNILQRCFEMYSKKET